MFADKRITNYLVAKCLCEEIRKVKRGELVVCDCIRYLADAWVGYKAASILDIYAWLNGTAKMPTIEQFEDLKRELWGDYLLALENRTISTNATEEGKTMSNNATDSTNNTTSTNAAKEGKIMSNNTTSTNTADQMVRLELSVHIKKDGDKRFVDANGSVQMPANTYAELYPKMVDSMMNRVKLQQPVVEEKKVDSFNSLAVSDEDWQVLLDKIAAVRNDLKDVYSKVWDVVMCKNIGHSAASFVLNKKYDLSMDLMHLESDVEKAKIMEPKNSDKYYTLRSKFNELRKDCYFGCQKMKAAVDMENDLPAQIKKSPDEELEDMKWE